MSVIWENLVPVNIKNHQKGFTITELLIVVTVVGIMLGPVILGMFYFYGSMTVNSQKANMALESQSILRYMTNELRVSSGVQATNTINDSNAPPEGWNTSNDDLVLIISTPAVDGNNDYIAPSSSDDPYENELIYYADEGELRERVLANPNATGNSLTTTCPPQSATASCPPDKTLTDNFKDMNFIFYDLNGTQTSVLADARSIKLFIEMEKREFGRTINFNSDMRVTLRNSLL